MDKKVEYLKKLVADHERVMKQLKIKGYENMADKDRLRSLRAHMDRLDPDCKLREGFLCQPKS